jgi:DNA-binding transcriptional LysR family regulator
LAIRGDAGRRPHQPTCSQKTACKLGSRQSLLNPTSVWFALVRERAQALKDHTTKTSLSDHFDGHRFFNPTLPKGSAPSWRNVIKRAREPLNSAPPLSLYREQSVSREAALAALQDGELTWEIVYASPSLTGVRAAALAGFAITPLPESAVIAGLRILKAEAGLPRLPDLEFAIYEKARPEKAAAALAAALLALAQGPLRPTI